MTRHKQTKKYSKLATVATIGVCGLILTGCIPGRESSDKQIKEVPTAQAQKDKPRFKDKSQIETEDPKSLIDTIKSGDKAVSAQTPFFPVVVHYTEEKSIINSNQLDLNADITNPDKPELVITYTDDYKKVTHQQLTNEQNEMWYNKLLPTKEQSFEMFKINAQLEGYGAYKDSEGNWQRIKSIKSRPEIESKYQDKGGRSAKEVEKANAKAEEAYTKMLNKYAEQMQGDTILDFSSEPELDSMTGGAEAKEGVKTLNRLVMEQADTIRKPFTIYTRFSWSQPLDQEGYEALEAEDYAYNYQNVEYGTLLITEAVDKMNLGYQAAVESLTDTEGATILTHIGIAPVNGMININGLTYNSEDVVLDLYYPNTPKDVLVEIQKEGQDYDPLKQLTTSIGIDLGGNIALKLE